MRWLGVVFLALSAGVFAAADPIAVLLDSAHQWESEQRPDLARLALEKLLRSQPGHPEASRRLGLLEIRSGRFAEARKAMADLERRHPQHPATVELSTALRLATKDRLQLATARRLYETQRFDEAAQAMRQLFPDGPPPGDYALEYWRVLGSVRDGVPVVRPPTTLAERRKPASKPSTTVAAKDRKLRSKADAALAAGRQGQALRYLEQAIGQEPAQPWVRFDLAKLYVKLGQPASAREVMSEGVNAAPGDPEMRYAAALVYSSLDDDAAALVELSAIPDVQQTDKTRDMTQRLRSGFERRRNGFFTAGFNVHDKPGSGGLSQYTALSLPMELRIPQGYDTHWTVHVDPVSLDAGTVPSVYNDAALFGQVQASGPGSLASFPSGLPQEAKGVDVGVAYETEDWRLDLGTTPIGFAVENWVGGVRRSGEWAGLSYRASLARRPITGSVLSYAGTRDPVSGQVWGGVVSNGVDVSLGYYGAGRLSGSFSAGAQRLTGRNVKPNDHLRFRAAADWAFVDEPSQQASAGLALTYWRYAEDLGEYTFGHGGYYSPQSYLSLALPLDWRGRYGRLGYLLRASASISRTQEDAQDFYPNDPALQAQATGSPLPSGFSQPVYGASSGGGVGYTLKAALEYRLGEHWFIGSQLQMDRSEYYTPNVLSSYFRYDFDGKPAETPYPPRPPLPYSDY